MADGGKHKLPNLKICIDNDEGSDNEDILFGDKDDYSFIDEPYSHRVEFSVRLNESNEAKKFERKKYENKDGNFVTGIDITRKEEEEKREERARRFGLDINNYHVSLDTLYASLGIREEDLHKDERGIRLSTVHVRGVQDMSTKDVFHYFQEFAPSTVEWIEDNSCNVVWSDAMTAARAMKKLSLSREATEAAARDKASKGPTQTSDRLRKAERQETEGEEEEEDEGCEEKKPGSCDDKMEVDEDSNDSVASSGTHSERSVGDTSDPPPPPEVAPGPTETEDTKEEGEVAECDARVDEKSEGELSSSEEDDMDLEKDYGTVKKSLSRLPENVPPTLPDPWCTTDDIPWPPGKWRLGISSSKTNQHIFMRYATKADRKLPGAEKRSQYYVRHGNPNYGGMKGLISKSRKRRIRSVKDDISGETSKDKETKVRPGQESSELPDWLSRRLADDVTAPAEPEPRTASPPPAKRVMRMYADDVEEELKAKRSGHSSVSHRIGGGGGGGGGGRRHSSISRRIGGGGGGRYHRPAASSVKDARQLLSRSDNSSPSRYRSRGRDLAGHSDDNDDTDDDEEEEREEEEDGEDASDGSPSDDNSNNNNNDLRAKLERKRMKLPSSVSSTSGTYPRLKIEVLD